MIDLASNKAISASIITQEPIEVIKEDLTQKAKELIQDTIDALDRYQMQEFVA
jgi:hypothetical protein